MDTESLCFRTFVKRKPSVLSGSIVIVKNIPNAYPLPYIKFVSHVLPVVIPAGKAVTCCAYRTLASYQLNASSAIWQDAPQWTIL